MKLKIADDKLNRNQELEKLFKLFKNFGNQNGHGITMLINGKYGSGKTTILNFIEEKATMEESDFKILRLNIWEEKLFDNPLFSLLHKISELEFIEENSNEKEKKTKSKKKWGARFKEAGWQLLKAFTKLDCKAIWKGDDNLIQEVNILDEYTSYKQAVHTYKELLIEYCEKDKIILLIDELDRCLPEYQIKALEVLHHFFDVPNLIVVIAMDKEQLKHSIKNIFGDSIDIIGYLNKFITLEVELPQGNLENYTYSLLSKIDIKDEEKRDIISIFQNFEMSLRDRQKLIEEISLIYNENIVHYEIVSNKVFGENSVGNIKMNPILISFLVALKKHRRDIYNQYLIQRPKENALHNTKISIMDKNSIFKQFLNALSHNIANNSIEKAFQKNIIVLINLISPMNSFDGKSVVSYCMSCEKNNSYSYNLGNKLWDYYHNLCINGQQQRDYIIERVNLI